MEVTVREEPNWQRVVDVVATQEDLSPKFEKAYREFRKKAKIEGFRRGKVPIPIIKKLYGLSIQADVVEKILPEIFSEARKQENLKTVIPAKVQKVNYQPGQDLEVEFLVEVEPEFELKKIEGFKFEKRVYEVDDKDVNDALENVRRQHAAWQSSDEPVNEQDFIRIDLQQVDAGGLPVVGNRYEDQLVQVVSDSGEMSEIGRQLLGASVDDKRIISLTPEQSEGDDGPVEPIKFDATVKEVKKRILPEVDDDLAKDTGQFETLEELKDALTENVQGSYQKEFDDIFQHMVIDELLKNNPIDVPGGMVDLYVDVFVDNLKKSSEAENREFDETTIREEYRPRAIWNIKWQLIQKKLQDENDISVGSDEIQKWVEDTVAKSNGDARRAWNRIKNDSGQMEQIHNKLLEEKTLDFLYEKQKIKEKKFTRKDLEKKKSLLAQ